MGYLWLLLIPVAFIALGLYVRHQEIKEFNNGKCECGGKFETFDTDSQGGTGWICNKCNNSMWTSWVKPEKYI